MWPFSFLMWTSMEFSESLKKNRDFKAVYSSRRSRANRYLVMYVMKNGTEKNRLGISVSKKVGNSVVRHRLTRLIREVYRLNEQTFQRGVDIVVVVRPAAKDIDFHTMKSSFLHLAGLHGIVKRGWWIEQGFDCDDPILQKVPVIHTAARMLYLYSYLFPVRDRSDPEVRRSEGKFPCN